MFLSFVSAKPPAPNAAAERFLGEQMVLLRPAFKLFYILPRGHCRRKAPATALKGTR
jgi:hypothetical protein